MHKLSRFSVRGLAFIGAIGTAGQAARADDLAATSASAGTLQEVVVTAQKREEKLHDVPMGVTAITTEELQ